MTTRERSRPQNRYERIIARIFRLHYRAGVEEFEFTRDEIVEAAQHLRVRLPKNLGDVIYSFR